MLIREKFEKTEFDNYTTSGVRVFSIYLFNPTYHEPKLSKLLLKTHT